MFVGFTLSLFGLMVKLGFWQLSRFEAATQNLERLQAAQQAEPLDATKLWQQGDWQGYSVRLSGRLQNQSYWLLDNQVYDGKVGYRWLALLDVGYRQGVLLDLGFVEGDKARRTLPELPTLSVEQHIQGRLYRPHSNRFNAELAAEAGWPKRIQALQIDAIAAQSELELSPYLVQLKEIEALSLTPNYQAQVMPPQKHKGYAIQWFTMASVLAVVASIFGYRQWFAHKELA
ncbi:SURF1-like protein [Paraferrimonas sedimenticola]|uniref:SURF1-like protein n=2 Tax=Paraferrimonas sedimenticola TaxID=375674 RepID=A0AA37RW19_9GAMM|nr:SURF1-like protein [Paraferrimonas sedimenticola]